MFATFDALIRTVMMIRRTLMLMVPFVLATGLYAQNSVKVGVVQALSTGNSKELAHKFIPNIDLTVMGASDVYSRGQAEQILRKFFDEHVPSGFSVEHEGVSKMGDSYYIGRLRTANGEFRVTFFVKRMDSAELVKQLRIEPSKGDL